jgi:hypothetical protein
VSANVEPTYLPVANWYAQALEAHGVTPQGSGWNTQDGVDTHYESCLGIVEHHVPKPSLLDFGCGPLGLVEYIQRKHSPLSYFCDYYGVDILQPAIDAGIERYPDLADRLTCVDILTTEWRPSRPVDYAIANGVFTLRLGVDHDDMWQFVQACVSKLFSWSRYGVAFNVGSGHVDYESGQWFHIRFDDMADFIVRYTRCFAFLNDYTPYGYTVYMWHPESTELNGVSWVKP